MAAHEQYKRCCHHCHERKSKMCAGVRVALLMESVSTAKMRRIPISADQEQA